MAVPAEEVVVEKEEEVTSPGGNPQVYNMLKTISAPLAPSQKFTKRDARGEVDFSSPAVDRSGWNERLVSAHPELLDWFARLTPLSRAIGFSSTFVSLDQWTAQGMTNADVLQLIQQHLDFEGFVSVRVCDLMLPVADAASSWAEWPERAHTLRDAQLPR